MAGFILRGSGMAPSLFSQFMSSLIFQDKAFMWTIILQNNPSEIRARSFRPNHARGIMVQHVLCMAVLLIDRIILNSSEPTGFLWHLRVRQGSHKARKNRETQSEQLKKMDNVILLGQFLEATRQYRREVWFGEFAVQKDLRFVAGQNTQCFVKNFLCDLPLTFT